MMVIYSPNRTPNIDCYRVGAVPKVKDLGLGDLGALGLRVLDQGRASGMRVII